MDDKILYDHAKKALNKAYAPYSNYKVGAALITASGKIYTGCNVENSSYGASICAERVALTKAISEGHTDIVALAVALAGDDEVPSPCGICRQFIFEFGDSIIMVLGKDRNHLKRYTISELLPMGFRLNQ